MPEPDSDRASLPGDEEREMLRRSVRECLQRHWRMPHNVADLWLGLGNLGVTSLGVEPSEGGLREILIVAEELGRAACGAPFLGGALVNLCLRRTPEAVRRLNWVHGGEARVALAFGRLDKNLGAGAARWSVGAVNGSLRFVDGAETATHLCIVITEPSGLAFVEIGQTRVVVTPTRALGGDGLCDAELNDAAAGFVDLEPARLRDMRDLAALGLLARAHGAARRSFEMAVDYAKERKQFGQPIGRFQAIQHKLANGLIALEGVRLTLGHAARAFDLGESNWRYFSSAAIAFGGGALRQTLLETHHAFGAIGYAEDHEAPRHFKRVHVDCVALGGAARAREDLAAHLLDNSEAVLPEYDLGPEGNAFRLNVRDWLKQNWSGERKAAFDRRPFERREFDPSFARDLGETGWIGLGWPVEFAGQARTPLEQLAFIEEMERAEAPRIGAAVQANALMMFGTREQQERYLPEILRGEAMHGMGYSEPGAGSDLAALTTRATREGDHWVINGQKIWTTTWWGKYMFLAARTDPEAHPKQAGISIFIVPMNTSGITIKPSKTMYDGSFANIFYDDVRVPVDALIGEVNGGWKVLTDALANERGLVGGGIVLKVAHAFDLLCRDVRELSGADAPLRDDHRVRDRIGCLAAEIEVGRQLMVHCAERAVDGITPPELGAISKVFSSELMERFGEAAMDILGLGAALSQEASDALHNGRYEQGLRHSLMWVISIGTNEIQRSLIAQRGLGLPR
jgi:alkylation response protein AidB-like acyl-CoA dehydrogenase